MQYISINFKSLPNNKVKIKTIILVFILNQNFIFYFK